MFTWNPTINATYFQLVAHNSSVLCALLIMLLSVIKCLQLRMEPRWELGIDCLCVGGLQLAPVHKVSYYIGLIFPSKYNKLRKNLNWILIQLTSNSPYAFNLTKQLQAVGKCLACQKRLNKCDFRVRSKLDMITSMGVGLHLQSPHVRDKTWTVTYSKSSIFWSNVLRDALWIICYHLNLCCQLFVQQFYVIIGRLMWKMYRIKSI